MKFYGFRSLARVPSSEGVGAPASNAAQIPHGAPIQVETVAGNITIAPGVTIGKFVGGGDVVWDPNGDNVTETFDSTEFRGVTEGTTLTLPA